MKYPQLVSTRAVSAISDWLVTQLEQLGVDASLVYSRLLLSLLHTPLQINALDLAEISEIKVHIFSNIYKYFCILSLSRSFIYTIKICIRTHYFFSRTIFFLLLAFNANRERKNKRNVVSEQKTADRCWHLTSLKKKLFFFCFFQWKSFHWKSPSSGFSFTFMFGQRKYTLKMPDWNRNEFSKLFWTFLKLTSNNHKFIIIIIRPTHTKFCSKWPNLYENHTQRVMRFKKNRHHSDFICCHLLTAHIHFNYVELLPGGGTKAFIYLSKFTNHFCRCSFCWGNFRLLQFSCFRFY